MNGLLRRLKRGRAATADENPPGTPAASEPVDATATQITVEGGSGLSEEEQERIRRRRDVPAGLDAAELEAAQDEGARRGSVRRRVRYLRRARELLMRDLGGFAYEVHRAGGGGGNAKHREILERKAERLAAVDRELRGLEARLGRPVSAETVLREPGIGGTCPECGELHGSDAGWCARCGTPLTERARKRHEQDVDRTIAARQSAAAEQALEERVRNIAAFPLAIPLMAGPGAITATVLLSGRAAGQPALLAGLIAVAVLGVALCLAAFLAASRIEKLLGITGNVVLSRLLGVLLAAMAVQFVVDGVRVLLAG